MSKFSFLNILVPYDGTQSSKNAFNAALHLAKENNSTLTVLCCLEKKSTLGFIQTKSDQKEFEKIKENAKKHVLKLKMECEKNDIEFHSHITHADLPSDCIVDYANNHKMNVIVISKSKLTTKLEKMHYNSTVENVLKKSPCSVLIVK